MRVTPASVAGPALRAIEPTVTASAAVAGSETRPLSSSAYAG